MPAARHSCAAAVLVVYPGPSAACAASPATSGLGGGGAQPGRTARTPPRNGSNRLLALCPAPPRPRGTAPQLPRAPLSRVPRTPAPRPRTACPNVGPTNRPRPLLPASPSQACLAALAASPVFNFLGFSPIANRRGKNMQMTRSKR